MLLKSKSFSPSFLKAFLQNNFVAIVSLLISIITIYLTQFQEPVIEAHLGDSVLVWHRPSDSANIIAPVSLVNLSNRLGKISRVVLVVKRKDTPDKNFVIEWSQIDKLKNNIWQHDSVPGVLAIPANESITKQIRFTWDGHKEFIFRQGAYELQLLVWGSPDNLKKRQKYDFTLDKSTIQLIESNSNKEKFDVTYVPINNVFLKSKILSSKELEALISQ